MNSKEYGILFGIAIAILGALNNYGLLAMLIGAGIVLYFLTKK